MISTIRILLASATIILVKSYVGPTQANRFRDASLLHATGKEDPKTPERKDLVRVLKQTIFPGIFPTYEDTVFAKPTIKIETKQNYIRSRNGEESFFSQESKSGSFNAVDEKSVPREVSASSIKSAALKRIAKPADFVAPVPKKAGNVKLGSAGKVVPNIPASATKQRKPIVIYDAEGSNDCKKVREALCILDLTAEFRPCPGRTGWSDTLATRTLGKRDVPFMIDENPSMYKPELIGADLIVDHLFMTYGPGVTAIPASLKGGKAGNGPGSLVKNYRNDFLKIKPIQLFAVEGAPYCKPVRECLQSLAIAHVVVPCAEGSKNRALLERRTGKPFQIPYIVDPNTGVEMFESAEIIKYLKEVYSA
eukprot:gene799-1551_t